MFLRRIGREHVGLAGTAFVLILCAVLQTVACAKPTRAETINAMIVAVDAAKEGFGTWEGEHQKEIASTAPTRESAEAQLDHHDQVVTKINLLIAVAYHALALAAVHNDTASLDAATVATFKLTAEIAAAKTPKGP